MPSARSALAPIRALEQAVCRRDVSQALQLLDRFIFAAEKGLFGEAGFSPESREPACTRLAAAITALLSDPQLPATTETYHRLCFGTRAFEAIFRLTGYHHLDHLLDLCGIETDDFGRVNAGSVNTRVRRLLLFLSRTLASTLNLEPAELFAISPHLAAVTSVNCLSSRCVISEHADRQKRKWLEAGPLMEQADFPLQSPILSRLSGAWMFCSYADAPGKHDFKQHANAMLRSAMGKAGLPFFDPVPRPPRRPRPLVGIPVEVMHARHAMYRCYGRDIRSLRERFHTVLYTTGPEVDSEMRSLCDEVVVFNANGMENVTATLREIAARQFDVLYYPSVGMRYWGIMAANLRLAPIQVCSIGHPATTRSPFVDYVVTHAGYCGDPASFSETVVLLRDQSLCYDLPAGAERVAPELRRRPDPVRLAVPSATFKLTAQFLARCCRIRAACTRPVEFHFFPNEGSDLFHYDADAEIHRWLPDAVVHARTDYTAYIRNLSACDLHLSTYPFGGTNSTIDSMRQGVPVITQAGAEPHSRTDALLMQLMGMPDWLITPDEESYERAALRLIHDDEERVRIAEDLLRRDVDATILHHNNNPLPREFLDALSWLYGHHEAIRQDGRHVWRWEDRQAFPPAGQRGQP
jgi:hypothetical protein